MFGAPIPWCSSKVDIQKLDWDKAWDLTRHAGGRFSVAMRNRSARLSLDELIEGHHVLLDVSLLNPELASLFSLTLELVAHPSRCRLENDQYVSVLCLNGTSPILFILGWLFYIQSKSMIIDHQCQYSVNMIVNMCQCHLHQSIISPLEDIGSMAPSQPPLNRKCLNYTNHTVMPEAPVETWGFTIQNEELTIKNSNGDAKIHHEKWEDIGNIYCIYIYISI